MKYFLSALAALVFTLASVIPSSADAVKSNTTVGVYGGVNWADFADNAFIDNGAGYVLGGVIGTDVKSVPGLRIEADVSLRQSDVSIFGGKIDVNHETIAIMANARYTFPVEVAKFKPYALAGVGYGYTSATVEQLSILTVEQGGVAFQLGAGVQTTIADGITADIGYRYLQTEELEVLGFEISNGSNHSIVAGLHFAL